MRTRAKLAFISAGVGVTPLRALAEALPYAPGDAVLLQRATRRPLFAREFDVLARERGLQLVWLSDRRRGPDSWLREGAGPTDDLTLLRRWVPDIADRDVYLWPAGVGRRSSHARRGRAPRRTPARRELRVVTP